MRIRSALIWGVVGSIAFGAIALLSLKLGSGGGFWGLVMITIGAPGQYIGAVLSSLLYGTVCGPIGFLQVVFLIYMGVIGFFIGYLFNIFVLKIRRKKTE